MLQYLSIRRRFKSIPLVSFINRIRLRKIYWSKPIVINLELTTKCNARCKMCPHPVLEIEHKNITGEALDKILDGLEGVVQKNSIIYPVGLGEPLLIPELSQFSQRIKARFPFAEIHFNTNGILLKQKRAEAFLEYSHRIVISLNSLNSQKYQELMGVDKFSQVVEGIGDFLAKRKIHPRYLSTGFPKIEIQMMGLDSYIDDFTGFKRAWNPLIGKGDQIQFKCMDNWGGKISQSALYSKQNRKRYPCGSIWRMVSVDIDGNVFPCCVPYGTRTGDDIKMGNINSESLLTILNGNKLKEIKQVHLLGDAQRLKSCANCDVYSVDPNLWFKIPFSKKWF